jgi:preprotein translocase subunit SecE
VVVVVVVGTIIIVLGFDFTLQRINSDWLFKPATKN